jgi:hypothetical protein
MLFKSWFSQKFWKFWKNRYFQFLQKMIKIIFLVKFGLKFAKNIKD